MQLGAYIDHNGATYIGNVQNIEWLHFDLPQKYTRILNENGGEVVSAADIAHARANYPIQNGSLFFDDMETKDFYFLQVSLICGSPA